MIELKIKGTKRGQKFSFQHALNILEMPNSGWEITKAEQKKLDKFIARNSTEEE